MVGEVAPAAGLATVRPARSPQSARRDGSRATEVLIVPGDFTCEQRARMQDAPPARRARPRPDGPPRHLQRPSDRRRIERGSKGGGQPAAPLRSLVGARADQGTSCRKGPMSSAKLLVLSTWMPAVWSPLNGVTVFAHPAAAASSGELNHNPR